MMSIAVYIAGTQQVEKRKTVAAVILIACDLIKDRSQPADHTDFIHGYSWPIRSFA